VYQHRNGGGRFGNESTAQSGMLYSKLFLKFKPSANLHPFLLRRAILGQSKHHIRCCQSNQDTTSKIILVAQVFPNLEKNLRICIGR
jgi:hypothetical protein